MNNVTLRQLRYFDALARLGHFGRAAEHCAVSQPALSVQIRELEAALGMTLVERGARKVRLTAFGEALAGRAEAILRAVDDLQDLARASRQRFSGRLRMGIIPTIAPYLLPAILREVMADHPGLDLHLRESLTPRLLEELAEGRLDCAVLALPISDPAFTEVELFAEEFVLVRPAAEAGRPVPGPERLSQMRLLLLEEGHCFRDQALAFCNLSPERPRELLDGSTLSTLVQMVGAGLGVTLIPEMALPIETRSAAVSVARFAAPAPARRIGIIWRASTPLAEPLRRIGAAVRRAALAERAAAGIEGPAPDA